MGNTILQNLSRTLNGLMLLESFESVNFVLDQGWSVATGVPTISSNVSYSGLHSLIMDLSHPVIYKTFNTPLAGDFLWSAGYFFDDPTKTSTNFLPQIRWKSVANHIYGLGAINSTSTAFYTKILNGVHSATAVARTAGWHKFEFVFDSSTASVILKIDGTTVSTTVDAQNFRTILVGDTGVGGIAANAFGYFDLIQVTVSRFFTVNGLTDNSKVTVFLENGTSLGNASASGGLVAIDVTTVDQPFSGYVKVTRADGVRPYFLGPVGSLSAGDVWTLNVFDLGRRVSTFSKPRVSSRDDLEASSGRQQSLLYYSRDMITLTLSDLTDDQVQSLHRWWGYAHQGSIFSAAIDSEDTYADALAAATIGNTAFLFVGSTVGLNKRSKVMVTRANGQYFEVAEVLSIVTPTQFQIGAAGLIEQYFVGDQVRSSYYWPACVTVDKAFNPVLINPRLKRWTVSVNFKEAL